MMGEWKPGDVAMLTIDPIADGRESTGTEVLGIRDNVESWACGAAVGRCVNDPRVVSARPVVVIDPEDREQVEDLCRRYVEAYGGKWDGRKRPVADMQSALRSLIAPPKPDEPTGLGAVVEDDRGARWTRSNDAGEWFSADGGEVAITYAEVVAVKVLSEGVQP